MGTVGIFIFWNVAKLSEKIWNKGMRLILRKVFLCIGGKCKLSDLEPEEQIKYWRDNQEDIKSLLSNHNPDILQTLSYQNQMKTSLLRKNSPLI